MVLKDWQRRVCGYGATLRHRVKNANGRLKAKCRNCGCRVERAHDESSHWMLTSKRTVSWFRLRKELGL